MKSNKTKGRILDTSIRLFNEKKASNVSTVQISTAMEISPGNLYYYYANKEEVIRCIWKDRMVEELDNLIVQYESIETADNLLDFLKEMIEHCVRYRFFYTEMPTLFRNDSTLMDVYAGVHDRVSESTVKMYKSLMSKGRMKEIPEAEMDSMAENGIVLIIGLVAQSDIRSISGFDISNTIQVVWHNMAAYLNPYFTDEMVNEMAKALKARMDD